MARYPSPYKEFGLNSHSATVGRTKLKVEKSQVLPTLKEVRDMRLKECDQYAIHFDGSFSDKCKTFNHKRYRREKK